MSGPNSTEEEVGVEQSADTIEGANEDKKHTESSNLGSNYDLNDDNTPKSNEKNDQTEQQTDANENGNEDKEHLDSKDNEQQTANSNEDNEDNEDKERNGSNYSGSDDGSNDVDYDDPNKKMNDEFNSHSVHNSELTTTNTSETDDISEKAGAYYAYEKLGYQPTNTTMNELQNIVKEEMKTEIISPANASIKNMKTEVKVKKTEVIQQVNNIVTSDGLNELYNKSKHEEVNEQANTNLYNDEPKDNSSEHNYTANSTRIHPRRPANQQFQTSKLLYIFMALVILIPAYFYSQFKKPTFLQNVAGKASIITIGIGNIEVPDINIMNNHVVTVRKVANTIDRNPVFKSYGSQIASGLREYGEKIRESGGLLRKMYSKGSSVHTSFEIEIEAMIQEVQRLNSRKLRYIQDEDVRYFKERLDRLITKLRDFRQSVDVAHNSILDAEEIKRNNEIAIENGFKEAKKFSDNEKYSIDISKASNELTSVNNILPYLHTASGQLDKLKTILKNYENSLRDVSEELDEENGVRFMMSDIRHLQDSIDDVKAGQHKFNQISD